MVPFLFIKKKRKQIFNPYGLSKSMGPQLRAPVEKHLLTDLYHYCQKENLKFDWSESCIEGKDTNYLDGSLENFSCIFLYDNNNYLVAEGWMEFVHSGDFFIAYWEFLSVFEGGKK